MLRYRDIWQKIESSGILTTEDTSIFYYSLDHLREQLNFLKKIFGEQSQTLHTVAIKTNPHPEILKFIASLNFGLEAASFEEVHLAAKAGVEYSKITYNSPVKTQREIDFCNEHFPGLNFNANSIEELDRLPKENNLKIGLRINPCVDIKTDSLYNVSQKYSKFGVMITEEKRILNAILEFDIQTLHLHVGSQVTNLAEAVEGICSVYELAEKANSIGDKRIVTTINIGGGIASGSDLEENQKNMRLYIELINQKLPDLFLKYHVITEFGQWTHRLNGVCFSTIEYVKHFGNKKGIAYIHLGGDMFLREIYTDINLFSFGLIKNHSIGAKEAIEYDIAGPLCYNGDYLIKGISLPELKEQDIFVIQNTGANTLGLWSRHCSRNIPKVLSFFDGEMKVLSERKNVC